MGIRQVEEPLISIITPAYNCEKFIEETILSVRNQTYQNWEHIIINDGSSDNTQVILNEYADKEKRACIIELEHNGGIAKARNKGIACAKGEFVAFLDSDDQWKQDKLEKQVKFMQDSRVLFSYTSYDVIDEQGRFIKQIIPARMRVNYKQLLYTNVMACCTIMIETNLIKKEEMPEIKHEDYATWLNVLRKNPIEAVCLQESLSLYRKVKTSVSANKLKTIGWNWKIYYHNQGLGICTSLKYLLCFIVLTSIKYIKK